MLLLLIIVLRKNILTCHQNQLQIYYPIQLSKFDQRITMNGVPKHEQIIELQIIDQAFFGLQVD